MFPSSPKATSLDSVLAVLVLLLGFGACGGRVPVLPPGAPQTAPDLLDAGIRALETGASDEAQLMLQEAIHQLPSLQEAHYYLGLAAMQNSDVGTANRAFSDALLLEPRTQVLQYSRGDIHYNLGAAYASLNRNLEALDQFLRATEVEPMFEKAWLAVANLQLGSNRPEKARATLKRATQRLPRSPDLQLALAELEFDAHETSEALHRIRRVITSLRRPGRAHLLLARARLKLGQAHLALAPLDRYLTSRPTDPAGWRLKGELLDKLGLGESAKEAFARSEELSSHGEPGMSHDGL